MSNEAIGKEGGKEGKATKTRKNANSLPLSAAAMAAVAMPHHRIPRPPNAFMIFANEHRKILAKKFPRESNKEISCRLGKMWRALGDDIKGKYHGQAKILDMEHKKKYPDYVYNPRDARLRKEARRQRIIAGNNLAKAMSHHIMVKQAKNNILNLNQQRLPGPISCLKTNLEEQMQQSQKVGIREQVLRGLGLDTADKRPLGYFISPNGQTFLAPSQMPMHLLQQRHAPPTSTITSPANFTYTTTSPSTQPTSTDPSDNANREQFRTVVSKLVNDAPDRPREAVTVQFVNPTSQESTPKNPLLTLANEAVSKLSESNGDERGDVVGEEMEAERENQESVSVSEVKIESEELEGKECIEVSQQMFLEHLAMRDKVQTPNQPGLIGVRPPMGCIQYAGSQQIYSGAGGGTNGLQHMGDGQSANSINVSTSPRIASTSNSVYTRSAVWDSSLDAATLMANNSIYSANSPYGNNYGNPVVPWSGGHVFYVPMQELAYTPTFPYPSPYQTPLTYQGNFKTSTGSAVMKPGDDIANLTFTINEDGSSGEGIEPNSGGKNFGQILTSTMQILTEEQAEQEGKGLEPMCHVNYDMVEKESSPNRQLAELTTAQTTAT
uniref:Sex-determining region Y protein n=1 Tax=Strigamia maritima TaxID=126957 RepID=T1IJJ4_STRMM